MITVKAPAPPSRAKPRSTPPRRPTPTLHAPAPRLRLVAPLIVEPPPRPPRRAPRPTAPIAPAPVLRLVTPPPPPPMRLVLRPPVAVAVAPPILAVPSLISAVPIATSVGVQGTGGTFVSMTPADLTLPGTVYITQFHINLMAGVW